MRQCSDGCTRIKARIGSPSREVRGYRLARHICTLVAIVAWASVGKSKGGSPWQKKSDFSLPAIVRPVTVVARGVPGVRARWLLPSVTACGSQCGWAHSCGCLQAQVNWSPSMAIVHNLASATLQISPPVATK